MNEPVCIRIAVRVGYRDTPGWFSWLRRGTPVYEYQTVVLRPGGVFPLSDTQGPLALLTHEATPDAVLAEHHPGR